MLQLHSLCTHRICLSVLSKLVARVLRAPAAFLNGECSLECAFCFIHFISSLKPINIFCALKKSIVYFKLILLYFCCIWQQTLSQGGGPPTHHPPPTTLLPSLDSLFERSQSVNASQNTEQPVAISPVSQDLIMKGLMKVIHRLTEGAQEISKFILCQ